MIPGRRRDAKLLTNIISGEPIDHQQHSPL
jgi:hypothetical protein